MTIHYDECLEEAERLTKVLGRSVEVAPINCDCDYSKLCYRCAGEGLYYEPVYASCNHIVKETDYDGCSECEEVQDARIVFRAESAPIKSCRDMQSEESEAA